MNIIMKNVCIENHTRIENTAYLVDIDNSCLVHNCLITSAPLTDDNNDISYEGR